MATINTNVTIVVTTIFPPTKSLLRLADMAKAVGWKLIVVGDRKTPSNFFVQGARYLSLQDQVDSEWKLATGLPCNHYARKNLGYLDAMALGAGRIVETDDDNTPLPSFFSPIESTVSCRVVRDAGWANVYRLFSAENVWPRGFPLDRVRTDPPVASDILESMYCPIQQGLADDDPDVDAIYRLVIGAPIIFDKKPPVALAPGALCPINSQNTAWWPDAYPLLYLPSNCSFRLTDIWRGLIAIRIAAEQGWNILFRPANIRQERNEHDLMDDFAKELDGYLRASGIARILADIPLPTGSGQLPEAMILCYEALCAAKVFPHEEIKLVESWLSDIEQAKRRLTSD